VDPSLGAFVGLVEFYVAVVGRSGASFLLISELSCVNQPVAGETFTNQLGRPAFRSTNRSRQVLARAAAAATAATRVCHCRPL